MSQTLDTIDKCTHNDFPIHSPQKDLMTGSFFRLRVFRSKRPRQNLKRLVKSRPGAQETCCKGGSP